MISFGELVLVIIVMFLLSKPSDLPLLLKYIKKIKKSYIDLQQEVKNIFNEEEIDYQDDAKMINDYIYKIIQIEGKYSGKYSLNDTKAYYNNLLKNKVSEVESNKNR